MLHRLATGDLYACRKLADDAEVDDHIIGFHALCRHQHNACYANLRIMLICGWMSFVGGAIGVVGSA
ncbi:MAG: hypothetical protein ACHP7P_13415 [Terriglobales bacterium]